MINTPQAFEDALQRVLAHLAAPPPAGSADDQAFGRLLSDLKAYRGTVVQEDRADETTAAAFNDLDRQAADFRRRYPDHPQAGEMSNFGFGKDVRGPS